MIVSERNKEGLLEDLGKYLQEYLSLSQKISFNGNKSDRADLNEYASTILDVLTQKSLSGKSLEWDYEKFREAKGGWVETGSSVEKIIETVTYNIGVYEGSLSTGEKWEVEEMESNEITFAPVLSDITVKLSDLSELKENYPQIKNIHLVSDAKLGEVNIRLKLFLDGCD
jgi:hypothetical protein